MKITIYTRTILLTLFCSLSHGTAANQPIVGAWQLGDGAANESLVYVFLENGIYFLIVDIDEDSSPGEFDGMERGTYTWNETTGVLSTNPIVSTNGSIAQAPPFDSVTVDGDVLTATDSEGSFPFKRVFSATQPLVGGWDLNNGRSDDSSVFVFLPNGIYFVATDTNPFVHTDESDGMERGTYSWDPLTGILEAETTVNTNGRAGLTDPLPDLLCVAGDIMTLVDPTDGPIRLSRVTHIPGSTGIANSSGQLTISFVGILQVSTDLKTWQDVSPQPVSPWTFTPTELKGFFVSRGK